MCSSTPVILALAQRGLVHPLGERRPQRAAVVPLRYRAAFRARAGHTSQGTAAHSAEHSLGVAVASYDGKVFFGLNADERATDVATLAHGIETSMAELVELAATGQALAALS